MDDGRYIPQDVQIYLFFVYAILAVGFLGYILNILKLIFGVLRGTIPTETVLVRITGVFVPFLGAIIGYF